MRNFFAHLKPQVDKKRFRAPVIVINFCKKGKKFLHENLHFLRRENWILHWNQSQGWELVRAWCQQRIHFERYRFRLCYVTRTHFFFKLNKNWWFSPLPFSHPVFCVCNQRINFICVVMLVVVEYKGTEKLRTCSALPALIK